MPRVSGLGDLERGREMSTRAKTGPADAVDGSVSSTTSTASTASTASTPLSRAAQLIAVGVLVAAGIGLGLWTALR